MSHKPLRAPAFIAPQLPVLSAEPPTGIGWIHEIKHDGYRTLIGIAGKDARAFTRSGLDWSDKYQRVIDACRQLRCRSALIDGEIIVQNAKGVSRWAFCGVLVTFIQKLAPAMACQLPRKPFIAQSS